MSPGPETVIARNPDLIVERLGEEIVMLNPDTDHYLRLNASGSVLWAALEQPATLAELAARLEAEFGIEADLAAADAEAFVTSLGEFGAISLTEAR